MEYLVGIIIVLIGLYLYQSSKRKDAEASALIADTKGQDKQLELKSNEIKEEINSIDQRLDEIKKQRELQLKVADKMTMEERAETSNKKFGK
jgi:hypothetical protein